MNDLGGEEMVEGNRRMMQWMAIEGNLAPDELRMKMPKEEWRGLTLLVDILDSSNSCTTIEKGRIVSTYDGDIEVVLMFELMLRRRIDWLSTHSNETLAKPDQHLEIVVRRRATNDGEILLPSVRDMWSSEACVIARGAEGLPVTDLAATFVLWAESGFPHEPATLSEQIAFVRSCESCDDFLEKKRRLELDSIRRAAMRRRERRLESIRLEREEIERRMIQCATEELESMGWRELMRRDRELRAVAGELNERMRSVSKGILDPEGA